MREDYDAGRGGWGGSALSYDAEPEGDRYESSSKRFKD
jgi:hypothetical protein